MKGRLALITGATSGIGLGIAKKMASLGVKLAYNGKVQGQKEINELKNLYKETYKTDTFYENVDVSNMGEMQSFYENARKYFNQDFDILVNCAGIQHVSPVHVFPPEKFEEIIKVNLFSVFYTTRLVIPSMLQQKWGRIINISSIHGMVASPYKSAYVSAKHGVEGFTKTVALEVAESGITVNSICPGYVDTPLVRNQIADTAKCRNINEEDVIKKVMLANQPTKQFVGINEIAELVGFLISDAAKNITGTAIKVDGGWTAQ